MKVALLGFTIFMTVSAIARAEDVLSYLTDKNGKYIGPTVEENVVKMDTDKNGFADVDEVRAFLQLKHGKDYEKDTLDRWLVASKGHSCGTNFAKDLSN
jgi:hypothetical protein